MADESCCEQYSLAAVVSRTYKFFTPFCWVGFVFFFFEVHPVLHLPEATPARCDAGCGCTTTSKGAQCKFVCVNVSKEKGTQTPG